MGKDYKNNKRSDMWEGKEKNQSDAWAYTKDPTHECERSTVIQGVTCKREPTNTEIQDPTHFFLLSNWPRHSIVQALAASLKCPALESARHVSCCLGFDWIPIENCQSLESARHVVPNVKLSEVARSRLLPFFRQSFLLDLSCRFFASLAFLCFHRLHRRHRFRSR